MVSTKVSPAPLEAGRTPCQRRQLGRAEEGAAAEARARKLVRPDAPGFVRCRLRLVIAVSKRLKTLLRALHRARFWSSLMRASV
jgi:hypothetical protein